jgi:NAD(P)-dependent dehydrogenase (short-subunit alcohol dehydrogenase family)
MRIALTGGSSGIGAAVAARLKRDGHHVTAFDLHEPQENIDAWVELNLADPASIVTAAEKVSGETFDVLINNAGLPPREGNGELVLQVNYFGLKQFMDLMLDRLTPGGAIVNTASRAGSMWRDNIEQVKALMALESAADLPGFVENHEINHVRAYNLSKEAVIVLTQTMTEGLLARQLRANSVSPAAVSTGILDDFITAFGERVGKAVARAGRPGNADEVADVICFLASNDSRWIKGQDIVIDGGISAFVMSDAING